MKSETSQFDPHGWMQREQSTDRRLRTFSYIGWGTTAAMLLIYGIYRGVAVVTFLAATRDLPLKQTGLQALSTMIPLLATLGGLGLLVGVLATIGTFMRFRTTSLEQIQMRLASIEEALLARDENSL